MTRQANRDAHGKFITIYPNGPDQAIILADTLADRLKNLKGPRVFTDIPWKDSIVHIRFGAILPVLRIDSTSGTLKPHMVLPDGTTLVDERRPYFFVPSTIEVPSEIRTQQERFENSAADLPFIATAVLHTSSGGAVYEAQFAGNPVIVKEGIRAAGLEKFGHDACWRRIQEARALDAMEHHDAFPKIIDTIETERAFYVIVERRAGLHLGKWIARHSPWIRIGSRSSQCRREIESYISNAEIQLTAIADALDALHVQGFSFGDLSPTNILIDEDNSISLVDLETVEPHHRFSNQVSTKGYFAGALASGLAQDTFALGRIALTYFSSFACHLDVFPSDSPHALDLVEERFGIKARKLVARYLRDPRQVPTRPVPQIDTIQTSPQCKASAPRHSMLAAYAYVKKISEETGSAWPKKKSISDHSLSRGIAGTVAAFSKAGHSNKFASESELLSKYRVAKQDYGQHLGLAEGTLGFVVAQTEQGSASNALLANWIDQNLQALKRSGPFLADGKAGLILALLQRRHHFGASTDETDLGIEICQSIEQDYYALKHLPPNGGLLHGWSGVASALALWARATNSDFLDVAEEMVWTDIAACQQNEDELLVPDRDFPRLMPYLGIGSAGILAAIATLASVSASSSFPPHIIHGLTAACSDEFYSLNSLLFGRAGIVMALRMAQQHLNIDTSESTHYQMRWIQRTTAFRGEGAFCFGYRHELVSFDYYYGAAGQLLMHIQRPEDPAPYLPFSLSPLSKAN